MTSKTTFEITRIWNMLCRQGPSERYAPLGLSFPPLPRRAPPIHEAMGGYAAPKAPAGQPCLDDELFPWLTTPIRHWPEQKRWMILRQITMSLENVTTLAGQVNTDPVRHSCRMDKSPLIFDPLDNRNPSLLINYQKVSPLEESQEVGMKWGLGRSTSFHTSM